MLKLDIKLAAFSVPNTANEYKAVPPPPTQAPPVQASYSQSVDRGDFYEPTLSPRTFLLSELDVETLETMCEDFKTEIFKRAGKSFPRGQVVANVPAAMLISAENLQNGTYDDFEMVSVAKFVLSLNA